MAFVVITGNQTVATNETLIYQGLTHDLFVVISIYANLILPQINASKINYFFCGNSSLYSNLPITTNRTVNDLSVVRSANEIKAHELIVSCNPPADWNDTESAWKEYIGYFKEHYVQQVIERLKNANININLVAGDEYLQEGILLEFDLYKIQLEGPHEFTGLGWSRTTPAYGWAKMTLRDIKSGKILYKSKLKADSLTGGYHTGIGLSEHMRIIMYHYSNAIKDLLKQGALGEGLRTQDGKK